MDLTPVCIWLNTLTQQQLFAMQTHFSTWSQLTSFSSSSLTWQLGKASVKNVAKGETIIRGGVLASSQVKCRETVLNSSISNHHPHIDGWTTAQPCPCLLSCFASYPILFLWINPLSLCHSSPLFLSFPALPWAWSHVHILHNKPRRMSTEQKQRG